MDNLLLLLSTTKKDIINNFKNIKNTFKDSINNLNKIKTVAAVAAWMLSVIAALFFLIEVIELIDFNSVTGFIPSSLEFAGVSISGWNLSQRLARDIKVAV